VGNENLVRKFPAGKTNYERTGIITLLSTTCKIIQTIAVINASFVKAVFAVECNININVKE